MGIINANKRVNEERIECGGTVKVTLSLTAGPCIGKGAHDIVFAIDRSGKMEGSALEAAKKGVKAFIEALERESAQSEGFAGEKRVGLVSFSDSATVNSMLSSAAEQAARAAEGLTAGGNSNPAEAIRAAVKLLDMKSPGEKILFLITDGQTPFRSQADSAAAEARQAGVTVYCVGIAAPDGVNREALRSWASGPSDSHIIEIRELGEARTAFERLMKNGCRHGATKIVINEEVNSGFAITSILTPTRGTATMINTTTLQWKIDSLGCRKCEGAVLEFYIRDVSQEGGQRFVNHCISYSDAEENEVSFPNPCVHVECCGEVRPDHCPEAVDFTIEGCRNVEVVDLGSICQEGLGRIVELNATIKNVCPGKKTAVAAILTEIGMNGEESERGMKIFTIPAQNGKRCCDIQVKGIRFVIPEDLNDSGGGSICRKRRLRARFIAHSIDSGITCPDTEAVRGGGCRGSLLE